MGVHLQPSTVPILPPKSRHTTAHRQLCSHKSSMRRHHCHHLHRQRLILSSTTRPSTTPATSNSTSSNSFTFTRPLPTHKLIAHPSQMLEEQVTGQKALKMVSQRAAAGRAKAEGRIMERERGWQR
uniref:Uncharacterized protein n=1 Tax=Opuntia streptacantha TaxID=393608 RepID=A0A7C9DGM2_OPUST